MAGNVIEVDYTKFDSEIKESKGLVVIDFWAPWCGPCRMMSPIFEELSSEMNTLKFCKINVDENSDLATNYRVTGIPFFVLMKDGKILKTRTGGCSKNDMKSWLEEAVSDK